MTMSKCINLSDEDAREACVEAAGEDRKESIQLCRAQRAERLALCKDIGEARYHPSFDPADFESDYKTLRHANPYFPLTIGYRWDYAGGDETNTIVALNETKPIEGVTCIVLNDKHVPRDLVDLFCSARDCVVTGESTALEPGTFHHKYTRAE